jgi:flagellum-specific ATP synthase
VIDPLGNPLDHAGILFGGPTPKATRVSPPEATTRDRLGPRIDLGVRALNCFATCRRGQRLGLFAGSGVGKSTLLSMLTRGTACDVVVLALVGERGREVRDFIENDLGPDGLARSVVVVATSDSPPLMRRQCAYTAMTVAEHFRDQGLPVLLLLDSVTRFCLALREIGLSLGEPPATRGYPPSVFAELPRMLERAGPGPVLADGSAGHITGLFTVLVEGDDHNEPVADAVRGILDGHIIMDRKIAEAGRYPAIDVLRSLSRAASSCLDAAQTATVRRARAILSLHGDMVDMVRLGAYRTGTDPAVDEALRLTPAIEDVLRQSPGDRSDFEESFQRLTQALGASHGTWPAAGIAVDTPALDRTGALCAGSMPDHGSGNRRPDHIIRRQAAARPRNEPILAGFAPFHGNNRYRTGNRSRGTPDRRGGSRSGPDPYRGRPQPGRGGSVGSGGRRTTHRRAGRRRPGRRQQAGPACAGRYCRSQSRDLAATGTSVNA